MYIKDYNQYQNLQLAPISFNINITITFFDENNVLFYVTDHNKTVSNPQLTPTIWTFRYGH